MGSWTADDGPLDRGQSASPRGSLAAGLLLVIIAVALAVLTATQLDRVPGREIAFVLLVLVILALAAVGLTVVRHYPRLRSARLVIDAGGITATHVSPQSWAWPELEQVAVEVLLRREVLELAPRSLRTTVWIHVLLRPTPEATAHRAAAGTLPASPRWRPQDSATGYPYLIRLTAPIFTAGDNLPIVRDVDAALRHYAGSRYVGVQEKKRYTP